MNRSLLAGRFAVQSRWINSAIRIIALTPLRASVDQNNVPLLSLTKNQWSRFCRIYTGTLSVDEPEILLYEELKALIHGGDLLLFDVREPSQCQTKGTIPGAVNIPIGSLLEALTMSEETFIEKYHVRKPLRSDRNVVFYGVDSTSGCQALDLVAAGGYVNCRHYAGGWTEWEERQKL